MLKSRRHKHVLFFSSQYCWCRNYYTINTLKKTTLNSKNNKLNVLMYLKNTSIIFKNRYILMSALIIYRSSEMFETAPESIEMLTSN